MGKETQMKQPRLSSIPEDLSIPLRELVIAIKGAGEMATGVACKLFCANIRHIFMMEVETPLAVRRQVSFCEAVYDQSARVEGIEAQRADDPAQIREAWGKNRIPVIVDPSWKSLDILKPHVVIDAVIAKKNLGTALNDAPLVIGLGPGFEAGRDVHMVIETNRGHNLGRIITEGSAEPNTGIPGPISGFTRERVLWAPAVGVFTSDLSIGDQVRKGDVVGRVDHALVLAEIDGVIRGLIRNGSRVKAKLKIGDIDPRAKIEYCDSISEKARTIGGSVLEAVLRHYNR